MKEKIKKATTWLVYSSSDATKYSVTIKSAFAGLITVATVYSGIAHVTLPTEDLTRISDAVIVIVQSFFLIVSSLAFVYGSVRKIYLTVTGQNSTVTKL
jgi:hypothetical protein